MGVRFKFGGMSTLVPGETILHSQSSFRLVSSLSKPSYRIGFQMPTLIWMTLHVTDRRLLLSSRIFLIATQDVDLWYPDRIAAGRTEKITAVSLGKGFFGQYLEVQSVDPSRRCRLIWSPELRLRFYCGNAVQLLRIVQNAMASRN